MISHWLKEHLTIDQLTSPITQYKHSGTGKMAQKVKDHKLAIIQLALPAGKRVENPTACVKLAHTLP